MMYVAELTPPSESEETVMLVPAGCQDGLAVYRKARLNARIGNYGINRKSLIKNEIFLMYTVKNVGRKYEEMCKCLVIFEKDFLHFAPNSFPNSPVIF
jgi:hypothetical protein